MGGILRLEPGFVPPPPLGATAAAIVLTLADFETPIWLDTNLSRERSVTEFLRFHTGARIVGYPDAAPFVLISDCRVAPPLSAFAQGTPAYPDLGATVIYQVDTLRSHGWTFAGPGIDGEMSFRASPLPGDFAAQLAGNRERFPLGVYMIFAGRSEIAALPRSVRLVGAG